MSREKGTIAISANFEVQKAGPYDAKHLCPTKAELVLNETWTAPDSRNYSYLGMITSVAQDSTPENNGVYQLKALPYSVMNNWEKIGGVPGVPKIVGDPTLLYTFDTSGNIVSTGHKVKELGYWVLGL